MSSARTCAHCLEIEISGEDTLCANCLVLPRCEICEVFFDGLTSESEQNPTRCDSCLDFEEYIKFECHICGSDIPLYVSKKSNVLHYIIRGNYCGSCNTAARTESRKSSDKEDKHQFIGYLAIIERLYSSGAIGKGEWARAVRRNKHDVTRWDGIEELQEDELIDQTYEA